MHLADPESFRQILEASGLPFVELNLIAAPLTEVVAGLLLITGYYARMGGVPMFILLRLRERTTVTGH